MSKFDKVFEARETSDNEKPAPVRKDSNNQKKSVKADKPPAVKSINNMEEQLEAPQKQRGRPKAKRSDPNFIGFTTYIRKKTHLMVKIALLQEGNGRELSELVEDLLSKWVSDK